MTTAVPYPIAAALLHAALHDRLLVCHQCLGDQRKCRDCPACLGTGFLRPCGSCFTLGRSGPCIVCGGLRYTGANPPEVEDTFNARPAMVGRRISSAA